MSIRKGNNVIASTPAVDAVPTQSSTNAVSSGGVYNALATKQDTISDLATIRAGAAAGATALQNTATATDALTVLGTSNTSWTNGINIGKDSRINSTNGVAIGVDASADVNAVGIGRDTDAGVRGTAIGAYAKTSADTGIAIGCWNSNTNNAVSSAKGAYQFGVGTNSTARTMNVGWYDDSVSPSTFRNYQLLDGNTGLIPDARISTNIARSTDIPDTLAALTGDVDINNPQDGQFLTYNGNTSKWINSSQGYANTDLSNLTSVGQNISNWSSNVTNCITEIPQDIKLELNAGTLTLKAGSKVYVPNGFEQDGVTPKFDEVVIANDLNSTYTDARNVKVLMFYDYESQANFRIRLVDECFSGSTAPTSELNMVWYDTVNNIIKFSNDYGSTWIRQYSLPVCIATVTATGFASIDQVFNGFGYIGSTVFALPGVKGLIPNGRNADGSLKSIEITVLRVRKASGGGSDQKNITVGIRNNGTLYLNGNFKYLEQDNKNIDTSNGNTFDACPFCVYDNTSGKISNFTSKTTFHAVDYSDTEFIAHQAMPSDKYITNLFPTSITTQQDIVAPADGFVGIHGRMSSGYACTIYILGSARVATIGSLAGAIYGGAFFAVQKGAIIRITLSGGTFDQVDSYFVYANGAK